MTDCTLFKLSVTFPLHELLHFKILIKAEPPVTSWFPLIAEAAANIKGGVTSLSWGQGVKLDNRLFVASLFDFLTSAWGQKDVSTAQQAPNRPRTLKSHNRHFILQGHQIPFPGVTDAYSLTNKLRLLLMCLVKVLYTWECMNCLKNQLLLCTDISVNEILTCLVLCLFTWRSYS